MEKDLSLIVEHLLLAVAALGDCVKERTGDGRARAALAYVAEAKRLLAEPAVKAA